LVEEADERRDDAIEAVVPAIAAKLIGSEDFAWGVLVDLPAATQRSLLQDLGLFFERFHNENGSDAELASIANALYREVKPTIEAAALEQARDEASADYDRKVAA
jgi:hypothetical protein